MSREVVTEHTPKQVVLKRIAFTVASLIVVFLLSYNLLGFIQNPVDEVLAKQDFVPEKIFDFSSWSNELNKDSDSQHNANVSYNFINPEEINVSDPSELTQEEEKENLKRYKELLRQVPPVYFERGQYDNMYNINFGDLTYLELYNEYAYPNTRELVEKMEEDLFNLVKSFENKYSPVRFHEKYDEVRLIYDTRVGGYPNYRAVSAIGIAELLGGLDGENEAVYEEAIDEYLARGIAYGMYSQSEIDVADDLVYQYLMQAGQNSEFITLFKEARRELKQNNN